MSVAAGAWLPERGASQGGGGALATCAWGCAARSARARPLGASYGVAAWSSPATNALAFSTRAETTAQNAADVRDLLRTRLSMTEADLDRVERYQPAGARATVEPKLDWFQARLELSDAGLKKMVLAFPELLTQSVEKMESNCDWLQPVSYTHLTLPTKA